MSPDPAPRPGPAPNTGLPFCRHCHKQLTAHCKRTIRHGKPIATPCGWGVCHPCNRVYRLTDMRPMPEGSNQP